MTKNEALKMAIEFMETLTIDVGIKTWNEKHRKETIKACEEALDTEQVREDAVQPALDWMIKKKKLEHLKEALAQEPYAYAYVREDGVGQLCWTKRDRMLFKDLMEGWKEIPLYTHPAPSWQELSDVELSLLAEKYTGADGLDVVDYGRAVMQAYGEKNYETA